MQSIFNIPIIGSILYGLQSIMRSVLLILKHPSLILFNVYATVFSTIWITLITWTEKLIFVILCWIKKWEYASLSKTIICDREPTIHLIGHLENIRIFEKFSNFYFHIKELFLAPTAAEILKEASIIIILFTTFFAHLLAFMYYNNYSTTAMAIYIKKLEQNPNANAFKALKLESAAQKRVWHWALLSTLIFLVIRLTISALFKNFPLYQMCKAHKFGFTPFTDAFIMLISFYAPSLLAYKKLSLQKMLITLFTTTINKPITTFTTVGFLSFALYFLPSCILPTISTTSTLINSKNLAIWSVYIIACFITPVNQVLLYRSITSKK